MIASALGVLLSGAAIFLLPGAVVLRAGSLLRGRGEDFAYAFATSLALLGLSFTLCLFSGLSISSAPLMLLSVSLAMAVALHRALAMAGSPAAGDDGAAEREDSGATPRLSRALLAVLAIAAAIAAVVFAPLGSVDRWWYLAYVRAWHDAPLLTLDEPFLGSGEGFARFGAHPWLFGLAIWSRLSGVDAVTIYESAAPVLVVLASVSAAAALARELFGRGPRERLTIAASMLLWSGALLPLLARAGEDKVLAAAVLYPLCAAAFLRLLREASGASRRLPAFVRLFVCAVATASVHALGYAFVLVALLPVAALLALVDHPRRAILAASVSILLLVAFSPALSGLVVRSRLVEIGASLDAPDHPVVRVHEARDRLIERTNGGYLVSPRLLLHPLVLLGFSGAVILLRRRAGKPGLLREGTAPDPAAALRSAPETFLLVTTLVPAAIAFVPPLPELAGAVIPPWMVYRVLWLLPLAPLAALAAEELASLVRPREIAAFSLLLLLGLPVIAMGARARLSEARHRVAAPESSDFASLVEALRSLPVDALVVAAPELGERLPAFVSRHVVAGLDRSTIVFAGSREKGEARLRARAALLAGSPDAALLAKRAGIVPTHAVFDPHALPQPRCSQSLFRGENYALCTLDLSFAEASTSPRQAVELPASGSFRALAAGEQYEVEESKGRRRAPWAASPPIERWQVALAPELQRREDLWLVVEASGSAATDELRVEVRGLDDTAPAVAVFRSKAGQSFAFRLPRTGGGPLRVDILSRFLPAPVVRGVEIGALEAKADR